MAGGNETAAARIIRAQGDRRSIDSLLTASSPLGPIESDGLVREASDAFRQLYTHVGPRLQVSPYIIGRKGAGKTSFITGSALTSGADVFPIESSKVYSRIGRFVNDCDRHDIIITSAELAQIWTLLMEHAAMQAVCLLRASTDSNALNSVWRYLSGYGSPGDLSLTVMFTAILGELFDELRSAPLSVDFETSCTSLRSETGAYSDASGALRYFLHTEHPQPLQIVVDNLEDLNDEIDKPVTRRVLGGLFEMVTRNRQAGLDGSLPFTVRFAFPAELFEQLKDISSNPEKDFVSVHVLAWRPRDLVTIAGNRLATSLAVMSGRKPDITALPYEPAMRLLKSKLPEGPVTNGLGQKEEIIPYLLRHTQLLPRHFLAILNDILRRQWESAPDGHESRVSMDNLSAGLKQAEKTIVNGVLSAYKHDHPNIDRAIKKMKNHMALTSPMKEWHTRYNEAGAARSGLDFHDFIDGAVAIGALGVQTSVIAPDSQYIEAEFEYFVGESVNPVEDRDDLCIHPLFVTRFFGRGRIEELKSAGALPIYPRGVM